MRPALVTVLSLLLGSYAINPLIIFLVLSVVFLAISTLSAINFIFSESTIKEEVAKRMSNELGCEVKASDVTVDSSDFYIAYCTWRPWYRLSVAAGGRKLSVQYGSIIWGSLVNKMRPVKSSKSPTKTT